MRDLNDPRLTVQLRAFKSDPPDLFERLLPFILVLACVLGAGLLVWGLGRIGGP